MKPSKTDYFLTLGLKVVQVALAIWPLRVQLKIARAAGKLYAHVAKRRMIAELNLRRAFGDRFSPQACTTIYRKSVESLLMTVVEVLNFKRMSVDYLKDHVSVPQQDMLESLHKSGRGAICLLAHMGNWELIAQIGPVLGYKLCAVVKMQGAPRLEHFLKELRECKGARMIARGRAAQNYVTHVKRGYFGGLVVDQDAGKRGVFVPLFNQSTSCPRGIASLAKRTGAPVIPVFNRRISRDKHEMILGETITFDLQADDATADEAIMANYLKQFQQQLTRYPEQWLWQHRRWKSSPNRRILILSDGKAGHLKQSMAFLNALRDQRIARGIDAGYTTHATLEVRYKARFFKHALVIWGILTRGRFLFANVLIRLAYTPATQRAVAAAWGDYIVSCGSAAEPLNAMLARLWRVRSAVIQKPQTAYPYDVVITPEHDRTPSLSKAFHTRGAAHYSSEPLQATQDAKHSVLWCVGGPSRRSAWSQKVIHSTFNVLAQHVNARHEKLCVTTSRRTPPATEAMLKTTLAQAGSAYEFVQPGTQSFEALLSRAGLCVITVDSVSMISEALGAGCSVIAVVPFEGQLTDPKLKRFVDSLRDEPRFTLAHLPQLSEQLNCVPASVDAEPERRGDTLRQAADQLLGARS